MRVRWAAQHDGLVVWIQEVLTEIADSFGEDAIREVVTLAYEHIWKPRYALWAKMTPEERLQLSVEGMRGGHLSGPRHRGDVGVSDEGDRFVMSLDPCGSCGVLRRGDPDSGRAPHQPAIEPGAPRLDAVPHRHGLVQHPFHDRAGVHPDGGGPAAPASAGGLRPARSAVPLVHLQGRHQAPRGSTTSARDSRLRPTRRPDHPRGRSAPQVACSSATSMAIAAHSHSRCGW